MRPALGAFLLAGLAATARADAVPDDDEAPAKPAASAPAATSAASAAPSPDAPPSDLAAPPADAVKSPSGLTSRVLAPGSGSVRPMPADVVELRFAIWTADGKLFDGTARRGQAAKFELQRVLPGLVEGVGLMVAGEKRRLWIPQGLAWNGVPGRPSGPIVADVELVAVHPAPSPSAR